MLIFHLELFLVLQLSLKWISKFLFLACSTLQSWSLPLYLSGLIPFNWSTQVITLWQCEMPSFPMVTNRTLLHVLGPDLRVICLWRAIDLHTLVTLYCITYLYGWHNLPDWELSEGYYFVFIFAFQYVTLWLAHSQLSENVCWVK